MHSQGSNLDHSRPKTIYELLIYDNQKLSSKSGEPHIIMRRTLKGSEAQPSSQIPSEPVSDETHDATESSTTVAIVDPDHSPSNEREDIAGQAEDSQFIGADAISQYIASLSSHVQSDVLRVVDAIIELEENNSEGEPVVEENLVTDKETAAGQQAVAQVQPASEHTSAVDTEESDIGEDKKKGIDLADIFKSLKKARKKAQQKSYSYTKKVEYEDQ